MAARCGWYHRESYPDGGTIMALEEYGTAPPQERFGPARIGVSVENYLSHGSTPVIRLRLGEAQFLLTLEGASRLSKALHRQVTAARELRTE